VHKLCVGPANQLMSRRLVLCSTLGLKTMVEKKNSKKEECAVQMTEENVHIQFPMADVRVIISPSNKAASPSLKKIHRQQSADIYRATPSSVAETGRNIRMNPHFWSFILSGEKSSHRIAWLYARSCSPPPKLGTIVVDEMCVHVCTDFQLEVPVCAKRSASDPPFSWWLNMSEPTPITL
jgi:hypothetical protein